jgi:4-amino-4-deoxy-L-arabinose transferase-like glycosyltransferase
VDHLGVGAHAARDHVAAAGGAGDALTGASPARQRAALAVVGGAALLRLLLAAWLPLFPDETYYWEWSRHLAGGYFDHPSGIAYLVRLGVAPLAALGFAPSPFAVRLGAVLAGLVASLACVGIARRLAGDRAGLTAAIVVSALPLAATGLVLATPDAPLLAAAACTLYCVVRALESPVRSRASLGWWTAAGVALGLAFTSKYTSILLPAGVLLAIASRRELRTRFAEPGPYVACAVATVVFLPVLRWNASHEWISFLFQIEHGLGRPRGNALGRLGEYLGGQAGLASPILFVLMAVATWRALRRADARRWLLAVVATLVFAFFAYSAFRKHVEPNWPAPAYIPAVALLAAAAWGRSGERWLRRGWIFAAALSAIVYAHAVVPLLPIPARRDPIAKAFGWDHLAARVAAARESLRASTARVHVGADRYQDASELSFHLARAAGADAATTPDVETFALATNLSGRTNQYDLWPRFADVARPGDALVLALDDPWDGVAKPGEEMHGTARALVPYFASVERGERVALKRGAGVQAVRRIYLLRGWRGGWPVVAR